jgi:hypothetical protein
MHIQDIVQYIDYNNNCLSSHSIDPYVVLHRGMDIIHQAEVIKNTLNPIWKPFIVSVERLCNNDPDVPISVSCRDWDGDVSNVYCTIKLQL